MRLRWQVQRNWLYSQRGDGQSVSEANEIWWCTLVLSLSSLLKIKTLYLAASSRLENTIIEAFDSCYIILHYYTGIVHWQRCMTKNAGGKNLHYFIHCHHGCHLLEVYNIKKKKKDDSSRFLQKKIKYQICEKMWPWTISYTPEQ